MTTEAIHTDADDINPSGTIDGAVEALLRREKADANKPSNDGDEELETDSTEDEDETDEDAEEPSDEDEDEDSEETDEDEESEDEDEDEKPKKAKRADPDAVAAIKVDGKEIEVPVKDLARLYGQEQALNRKNIEVANRLKEINEHGEKYVTGLDVLLKEAIEEAKQYENIDWIALAKDPNVSAEQLNYLRSEAQKWNTKVAHYTTEIGNVLNKQREQVKAIKQQEAVQTFTNLAKPASEGGIENWSESLYNDIIGHAVTYYKADPQTVRELTDEVSIRVLHDAMMYRKGLAALNTKTTKVIKTPKRVVKSTSKEASVRSVTPTKANNIAKHARRSGNPDDVMEWILADMVEKGK